VADVFVSYSRRDGAFISRLVAALNDRGKETWVDVQGIRDAEVFPAALRAAIEQSDGFLFVISPDSVASSYCEQEVEHARALNKRIVPLLLRPVADGAVPEPVRIRNWIPFAEERDFESGVARVLEALDTDLEWAKAHTRWLVKALEWDAEGREKSFLLRGSELAAAEAWLAQEAGKEPAPTGSQHEYVAASRVAAARRQRTLLGLAAAVTAVSLGLLVFALISRSQAIAARNTARTQALTANSQALAAESQTQLAVDPERSILLATAALHKKVTPEATFALRAAIDASPVRFRLPDAGPQTCGLQGFAAPGVAFDPDGRTLAEGLCRGVVVLADAHSGSVVRRVRAGNGPLGGAVAFAPGGRELATCCRRGHVVLLDATTGAFRKLGPQIDTNSLVFAFDPKAPVLAAVGRGDVVLWNYSTGRRQTFRFAPARTAPPVVSLAFSPDGRLLAGSVSSGPGSPGIGVYDLRTGRRIAVSSLGFGPLAFSKDGRTLAGGLLSANDAVGSIVLLDPRTLHLRRTLLSVQQVEPTAVAFSPDGSELAYGYADGTAGLVSATTGSRIASYLGQTAAVNSVAFSPDGRFVATASVDGTTRIWRASGEEEGGLEAGGIVYSAAATKSGLAALAVRSGLHGQEFVLERWTGPAHRPRPVEALAPLSSTAGISMSADGRFVAGAEGAPAGHQTTLRLWNAATGRLVRSVPRFPEPTGGDPVFSPDDSLLALALTPSATPTAGGPGATPPAFDQPVGFFDLRTGKTKTLGSTSCGAGWRGYSFSGNERLLATGDFCGRVEVWSIATGRRVGRPFTIGGELAGIAFAPDGRRIAVAGWNGVVTVADAHTGRVVAQLTGDTSGVHNVAYSPDGRYLASVSLDHTARIYDARTLRLLRVWEHPDPVNNVGFSPDSRQLDTVDTANVVRIWDACTDCENPRALLALAAERVTRTLTPQEKRTFGVG
jgi:WD40 repeat protein